VTAFVGPAAAGALNTPTTIRSFDEYHATFGGLDPLSEMSYAVWQFFANGGTDAIVVAVDRAGGEGATHAGMTALTPAHSVNLLCLPGNSDPGTIAAATEYCEAQAVFLIADPPRDAATPAEVLDFVTSVRLPASPNAALYYPWLNVADPLAEGAARLSAPCGTVAGVYARNDIERGVWQVPGGASLDLRGVISPGRVLRDAEEALLDPHAVNAIRTFPQYGNIIWGARTLASEGDSATDWKYVPVRRLALYIESSVREGLRWAAFETNDASLWESIRDQISAFMTGLWTQGAFARGDASAAFVVECDATTTTPDDMAAGVVNVIVCFAPVTPGEFVVLQIQIAVAPASQP
jgi:phage tail sheath protein FI